MITIIDVSRHDGFHLVLFDRGTKRMAGVVHDQNECTIFEVFKGREGSRVGSRPWGGAEFDDELRGAVKEWESEVMASA